MGGDVRRRRAGDRASGARRSRCGDRERRGRRARASLAQTRARIRRDPGPLPSRREGSARVDERETGFGARGSRLEKEGSRMTETDRGGEYVRAMWEDSRERSWPNFQMWPNFQGPWSALRNAARPSGVTRCSNRCPKSLVNRTDGRSLIPTRAAPRSRRRRVEARGSGKKNRE